MLYMNEQKDVLRKIAKKLYELFVANGTLWQYN